MSTADYQARLDQLIEDLDLSIEEREWIQGRWKADRIARRAVNAMSEVLEVKRAADRRAALDLVYDAIKGVRAAIAAEHYLPPAGYLVVSEEALEALRELAMVQALLEDMGPADPARHGLASRRAAVGRMVLNVDPVVSKMLEAQA